MSPEQLQGLEADARSDIFFFGLVLYEMLTGVPAFQANSSAGETSPRHTDDFRQRRPFVGLGGSLLATPEAAESTNANRLLCALINCQWAD
jgi:serine/threonine protein kinase